MFLYERQRGVSWATMGQQTQQQGPASIMGSRTRNAIDATVQSQTRLDAGSLQPIPEPRRRGGRSADPHHLEAPRTVVAGMVVAGSQVGRTVREADLARRAARALLLGLLARAWLMLAARHDLDDGKAPREVVASVDAAGEQVRLASREANLARRGMRAALLWGESRMRHVLAALRLPHPLGLGLGREATRGEDGRLPASRRRALSNDDSAGHRGVLCLGPERLRALRPA